MFERDWNHALAESIEDVLEKMFFISALQGDEPQPGSARSDVVAQLSFEGEPSGWLVLRISGGAARSIAADFLGAEEQELTSAQVGEVICELANMICGSVLSRVESEAAFRLESPRLLPPEMEIDCEGAATRTLDVGDGRLTAFMKTGNPACPTAEKSVC
ncbi:MAG TPA: chemotaxis protein CheX [Bryobacteraceae bacterium]|nr:chemotaxis protein CheX [Bryobacteraceae bacterium]